jgi:hypothetical protein
MSSFQQRERDNTAFSTLGDASEKQLTSFFQIWREFGYYEAIESLLEE